MLLPGLDLHYAEPLNGDICNIFLPNIGENHKVLPSERGAPVTMPYGKIRPWLLHYVHRKVR